MRPIHDATSPAARPRHREVAAEAAALGTAFGMEVSLGEPAPLARAPAGAAAGVRQRLCDCLERLGAAFRRRR